MPDLWWHENFWNGVHCFAQGGTASIDADTDTFENLVFSKNRFPILQQPQRQTHLNSFLDPSYFLREQVVCVEIALLRKGRICGHNEVC